MEGVSMRADRIQKLGLLAAGFSFCIILASYFFPYVRVTKLGVETAYSLFKTINQLWIDGNPFLALVVLGFSVVFPLLKLVFIGLVLSPINVISNSKRQILVSKIELASKWCTLDVLVIAILVVSAKTNDLMSIEPKLGLLGFTIGVIFSMAAANCMENPTRIESASGDFNTSRKENVGGLTSVHSRLLFRIGIPFLFISGILTAMLSPPDKAVAIHVSKIENPIRIPIPPLTPSYFLQVATYDHSIRLKTLKNTKMGNGLTWELNPPFEFEELREIQLHNDSIIPFVGGLKDRVTIKSSLEKGEAFNFEIKTTPNFVRLFGTFIALLAIVLGFARFSKRTITWLRQP